MYGALIIRRALHKSSRFLITPHSISRLDVPVRQFVTRLQRRLPHDAIYIDLFPCTKLETEFMYPVGITIQPDHFGEYAIPIPAALREPLTISR